MKFDLAGKGAVVTGSTGGIGYAIAKGLAESGAEVVITGRDMVRAEAAAERLRSQCPGAKVTAVAADLEQAEGTGRLIAAAASADILVNNLGIYGRKAFFDIEDADWQHYFDVNVMSGIRLSRHYARGMRERGWGRIIFVSSESALHIPPEMVHYGMTKTAPLAVSRGLAEALAGTGVTVNAILPGPTSTETATAMRERAAGDRGLSMDEFERAFFREARPTSLIGRFASPEEVAAMAVYLASPLASATTGAALRVDGGIVRTIA